MILVENPEFKAVNDLLTSRNEKGILLGYIEHYVFPQSEEESDEYISFDITRKTMNNLTTILSTSFENYDFKTFEIDDFRKEPFLEPVMKLIHLNIASISDDDFDELWDFLWSTIDEKVCLKDSDVYSYNPGINSGPYSDLDCQWAVNYFFYNEEKKTVVFFTLRFIGTIKVDDRLESITFQSGDSDNDVDDSEFG